MDVVFDRVKREFFRSFLGNDGGLSGDIKALPIFNRTDVVKQ
jgi:hypothetical protein